MGFHFLLQGIFLNQGLNLQLVSPALAGRFFTIEPPGSPSCGNAAAAKSLQLCPTLCNPRDSSPPGSPVHGICQERVLECVAIAFSELWECCCCCIASVVSNSVQPQRRQATRLPRPQDSPGKNTGVGCHFLLQCMEVKSENEVTQSCLTLSDPMDCSLPGSSVHGIFQARVLEWRAIAFSGGNNKPQIFRIGQQARNSGSISSILQF